MPYEGRVWPDLVRQMDDFVHNYNPELNTRTKNVSECIPGFERKPGTQCLFDIRTIAPECTKGDYGYATGTPCVFLQFNNISGWTPELYTDEDFYSNNSLPETLRQFSRTSRMVFIECKGMCHLYCFYGQVCV